MGEYYFIAQLPSLDAVGENAPLPITEERFLELAKRYLSEKAFHEVEDLTLMPPQVHEKSNSKLISAWNSGERNLRLALGKIRAEKLKKQFNADTRFLPQEIIKTAKEAVENESPLEAERFLNRFRLKFLDSLRPTDMFSVESVYYYGLRLKLLSRIRQFDSKEGEEAYKNIYNSIMNGDRLEAIQ